jgi:hypothetical protein
MSVVTRRNDFIMQNHFVEKWETLSYNMHENYQKKKTPV